MHTRSIPSSGEAIPVIGLGTWQAFDVGSGAAERARLGQVLDTLFQAGGRMIDSSPMYGQAEQVVIDQLQASIPADMAATHLTVAYEPVWAIGTGVTASVDDAQGMCSHIRNVVESIQKGSGEAVRIQYGGSVKPSNATELMACADIDGALVGGAALDSESFARIVMYQEV